MPVWCPGGTLQWASAPITTAQRRINSLKTASLMPCTAIDGTMLREIYLGQCRAARRTIPGGKGKETQSKKNILMRTCRGQHSFR